MSFPFMILNPRAVVYSSDDDRRVTSDKDGGDVQC